MDAPTTPIPLQDPIGGTQPQAFGADSSTRSSKSRAARTAANPLFPVNLADLLIRHSQANHKRETIAFSKRRACAAYRMWVFVVWRNTMKSFSERRRDASPAQRLGLLRRRLRVSDVLAARVFPAAVFWYSGQTKVEGWRVTENAVALFREDSRLWWLSAEGRPIALYDPRVDSEEYVLVTGDRGALPEAVELLEDLRSAPADYFSALSEISALPDGGFGIMDSVFRRPVRVLRRDAPAKIRALLDARGFIESRGWEARAIDLRFADRIVLVGAYGAGNSL